VLSLALAAHSLHAGGRELQTVVKAAETVHALAGIPGRGIPRSLLHDAAGVAVLPHVLRAGLLVDGRFGRGVVLARLPDGRWSDPVFVTIAGGGVGGQVGVEETDLVLVFKTPKSLERALRGRLTLGGDVTVAAGPVGREAEAAADRPLHAEVLTYSRSRGLFAGVSLEGAHLRIDPGANEDFYHQRGCRPEDILAHRGPCVPIVEALKEQLAWLATPPGPPPLAPAASTPPPPGRR
jgi:lipid-binding SYLF domain-containing protein